MEVANNFRSLTEIRFKLLAFLPIAAATAAVLEGGAKAETTTALTTLALSLFGLIVTGALVSYNARNDQLYDELVGRAASIERSLGLPDGAYANRPTSWFALRLPFGRLWEVSHRSSVALIYGSSLGLWLFLILLSAVQLAYSGDTPAWWAVGAALLLAIALISVAVRRVTRERVVRQRAMRMAAELAVGLARPGLATAAASTDFCTLCAGLRDKRAARSRAFWSLLEQHAKGTANAPKWVLKQRRRAVRSNDSVTEAVETARKRSAYYAEREHDLTIQRRYGLLPPEDSPSREAYFVALITDLPPRWIDDVATGRR